MLYVFVWPAILIHYLLALSAPSCFMLKISKYSVEYTNERRIQLHDEQHV